MCLGSLLEASLKLAKADLHGSAMQMKTTNQSEGGTFRTAYSIPGRGNGAGWEQILHHLHLVRRAPGWPPLL